MKWRAVTAAVGFASTSARFTDNRDAIAKIATGTPNSQLNISLIV